MHFSKLIHVLQAFDERQFRRLKEYVHCSYFKTTALSVALFDYLAPLYPDFPEKKLGTQTVSAKQKKLSTALKQRKASSELLKSIEYFIALEDWQKNMQGITWNQLNGFKQLNLPVLFNENHTKVMKQINENHGRDSDSFFQRHLFTELSLMGLPSKANDKTSCDINSLFKTLDESVAFKKLLYLCVCASRGHSTEGFFPRKQITTLLKTLRPYTKEEYPYVYLFVNIYRMLSEDIYTDSELPYRLVKQFILKQPAVPLSAYVIESISYCVNYNLLWYTKGHEESGKEYLWWQELKMNNGWLLHQNQLKPVTFRNIVCIAEYYRSVEWLAHFIRFFGDELPEEYREANLLFANGLLNYREKKYKDAIRCFLMIEAKGELTFKCQISRWQWICDYEYDRSNTKALNKQLHFFEKYLCQNKDELGQYKKAFDKFIFYAGKLIPSAQYELSGLVLYDLNKETHFPGKQWLIQQIRKDKCQEISTKR